MRGRIEPAVGHVFFFASEIQLGHQAIEPPLNGEMNVRRPDVALCCRIAARFDGTKAVVPGRIRCETREAFEIGIERRRIDITRMTIFPRRVGLPDVNACMRHRRSRTREHASAEMDELAQRLSGAAAWTRQIGCQIGVLRDRVERADNLRRRDRQCCCIAATRLGFGWGLAHQGSLISASLTTLPQWAMSLRIPSPNSAAVPPTATAPILSSEARIFGSRSTLLIALLSCDVTSAAVPRFAAKPIQSAVTRSGKPASNTVGMSPRAANLVGAGTASARNLPVGMGSKTGSGVTNMYWTLPLIRSVIAWENCW